MCLHSQIPHIKDIQLDPSRLAAFMLAEVSFLVALASLDNNISKIAAKGLRLISYAERMPNAPVNPYINDDDKSKRNPIYEQLGDPGAPIGKQDLSFFFFSSCVILSYALNRSSQSPETSPETDPYAYILGWNSGGRLARML